MSEGTVSELCRVLQKQGYRGDAVSVFADSLAYITHLESQLAARNQAAEAMQLRIVRAAILDDLGGVHSLPIPARHHEVIAKMREAGWTGSVREQGFLLSDGRFCRRKPAERVARESGQLKGDMISGVLTSEDLW